MEKRALLLFMLFSCWAGAFQLASGFANSHSPLQPDPQQAVKTDVLNFKTQLSSQHHSGNLLVYLGYAHRHDWEAPVSGLKGRLDSWGMIRADYWVASNVALQVRGVIHNRLRSTSGQFRKTFWDVGDFSVSTIAFFFQEKYIFPAFGIRLETKLPNSNLSSGLGTNTTDILICGVFNKKFGDWLLGGELGVGILAAPKKVNEQNDVLMYRGAVIVPVYRRFNFAAEVSGYEVTRPKEGVPLGTESRGVIAGGFQFRSAWLSIEAMMLHGLHRRSGEWGVRAGAGVQIPAFSQLLK